MSCRFASVVNKALSFTALIMGSGFLFENLNEVFIIPVSSFI